MAIKIELSKTVAVLLAVYNGAEFLEDLLESIMHQTHQDFVCFAHDDGSTDCSKEILFKLQEKYPSKIVVLDYPSTGSAKANFISLLRGRTQRYVMFADQDDIWLPEKIEKSLAKIEEIECDGQVPALVFTDLEIVDSRLETISPSFYGYTKLKPDRISYQQLLMENVGSGCTIIMNNALAKLCTRITDTDSIYMHDWWFMLVAAVFGRIAFLDEVTILYRQHVNNNVGATPPNKVYNRLNTNFDLLFSHKWQDARLSWLKKRMSPARELLKYGDLPAPVRKTLTKWLEIGNRPKLFRIYFYLKNGFLRNSNNFLMLLKI